MKVKVNDKDKIVPVGCTLEQLTQILGIKDNEPVAVALGTDVIEREAWKTTKLNDHDKITIIRATCGG
ncbi:MAG: sulfur carrier protein ThiS [Bacteroidales bacterium]|nr:sulfur carrier protein ThiS [Bacteroidales bacterium]